MRDDHPSLSEIIDSILARQTERSEDLFKFETPLSPVEKKYFDNELKKFFSSLSTIKDDAFHCETGLLSDSNDLCQELASFKWDYKNSKDLHLKFTAINTILEKFIQKTKISMASSYDTSPSKSFVFYTLLTRYLF
jgi:hypothetical protein